MCKDLVTNCILCHKNKVNFSEHFLFSKTSITDKVLHEYNFLARNLLSDLQFTFDTITLCCGVVFKLCTSTRHEDAVR